MKKALLLAGFLALWGSSAEASSLAPHRAIYELTLMRTSGGANLQSAAGRLAFEIQGSSCEGYRVSFRMAAKYRASEGSATLVDTRSATFESPGSLDFRHQVKELVNNEVKKDTKIKLKRTSTDAEGQGEIDGNGTESFTIPAGTSLPLQHQLKLMALGEAGGGRDSSVVFDGSDGGKVFRAISFVGKEKPPGSIERDLSNPVAAPLKAVAAWPITVSYFPESEGQSEPEYQVSFDLYGNGVASGLVLDYGEFALTGTLTNLEMLTPSECP